MISAIALMIATQEAKAPGTVETPFKMTENAMVVDAVINGKKVSLMFDTGFAGWAIVDSGINMGKADRKIGLRDFVGTFEVDGVGIKSLKLGEQSIPVNNESEVVLQPGADNSSSYGTHCDGIMGLSVIKHNITEINFEKSKFVFHPNTVDISKWVPDNKKTFLARLLPTGMSSLEMQVKTEAGKSMMLALDTGNSFFATTHTEVLDRVGIWPITKRPGFMSVAYVASGPVDSWYIKMPKLSIFGVPVENSVWSIIDLPSSSADGDGTVGFGFLKNFNVIIDYERRRVWLENFTGKVANEEPASPGLNAAWDPTKKSYIVVRVQDGGPAEKAGVKRGDQLLSVGDDEALNIGYERMNKKLEGPAGTKVKLAFSRAGTLIRHEIERKSLVNVP